MKKYLCTLLLAAFGYGQSLACAGGDEDWDDAPSGFFNQETIENDVYKPFLRTYRAFYGANDENVSQNCKDWAAYFGIKPYQACYLVNKASRNSIEVLLQTGKCDDDSLKFFDKKLVKAKKAGLNYLNYAKYIEPYMTTEKLDEWDLWSYRYASRTIDELKYEETLENLMSAYESQTDKELKIRYGYQIVRLAHYKRHYNDAVDYFNKYVEALNYKPEVYYYALNQKAGALRVISEGHSGTKPVINSGKQTVLDFMTVFAESKDMKYSAYKSLQLSGNLETATKMANKLAKNDACNVYFLLAYNSFNNPLRELGKILSVDANAPHAKVLMARYINEVEDNSYNSYEGRIISARKDIKNIDEGINIAHQQALRCANQDKDFWNLASAFLHTYCLEYDQAKSYLAKVNGHNQMFKDQKELLATLIDLISPSVMTSGLANSIFEKHTAVFENGRVRSVLSRRFTDAGMLTEQFLANNDLNYSGNANSEMWSKVIAFVKKPNKSKLDKWLIGNDGKADMAKLNNNLGMAHFYEGNIDKAFSLVNQPGDTMTVPKALSYNVDRLIYSDPESKNNFYDDYVSEVAGNPSFKSVSVKDIIAILHKINQKTKASGNEAAKANFLIGNFYYNFSSLGYYRNRMNCSIFSEVAAAYYFKALGNATDRELQAKALFGLAKANREGDDYHNGNQPDEPFFPQLKAMNNTKFFNVAKSKCAYFADYVDSADTED